MGHSSFSTLELPAEPTERVMGHDPLAQEDILTQFYRIKPDISNASLPSKAKPEHYKVICISLYKEDLEKLDFFVAQLKQRGHTKANKSQVIRAALEQLNLDLVRNTR